MKIPDKMHGALSVVPGHYLTLTVVTVITRLQSQVVRLL